MAQYLVICKEEDNLHVCQSEPLLLTWISLEKLSSLHQSVWNVPWGIGHCCIWLVPWCTQLQLPGLCHVRT